MEPRSNLEFWNYNDRPDLFAVIPLSDDPLERMIAVVKWFLSKDTKWKNNQIRKPFNPVLGEFFHCHWNVDLKEHTGSAIVDAAESKYEAKVSCVTEQIMHQPPVSAFYYECKKTGVIARGVDHVTAKFTGTSVKVGAGDFNHGVFVQLTSRENEEYNCSYPWASLSGLITGKPYITVSERSIIICPVTKIKCIILYKDEVRKQ